MLMIIQECGTEIWGTHVDTINVYPPATVTKIFLMDFHLEIWIRYKMDVLGRCKGDS